MGLEGVFNGDMSWFPIVVLVLRGVNVPFEEFGVVGIYVGGVKVIPFRSPNRVVESFHVWASFVPYLFPGVVVDFGLSSGEGGFGNIIVGSGVVVVSSVVLVSSGFEAIVFLVSGIGVDLQRVGGPNEIVQYPYVCDRRRPIVVRAGMVYRVFGVFPLVRRVWYVGTSVRPLPLHFMCVFGLNGAVLKVFGGDLYFGQGLIRVDGLHTDRFPGVVRVPSQDFVLIFVCGVCLEGVQVFLVVRSFREEVSF